MPIIRYDPFANFFDDAFERSLFQNNTRSPGVNTRGENKKQLWQPRGFQVHQDEKAYFICVDVPGVKKEDMKMQLVNNNETLHLSGCRKFKHGDDVEETKFERHFTIGSDVDVEKINADLSNGVLTITAPKKEPAKDSPRFIAIKDSAVTTE
eukprot:scaffold344_cov130-Cylindrotheca_fusiformis.AAC.18